MILLVDFLFLLICDGFTHRPGHHERNEIRMCRGSDLLTFIFIPHIPDEFHGSLKHIPWLFVWRAIASVNIPIARNKMTDWLSLKGCVGF